MCYPAFCYVSELVTFPCTARDRDLDKLSLQMNKKSMQTAFILQRRPEVFGTCPLFFKNKYGLLLSAATSYGRESENQVRK